MRCPSWLLGPDLGSRTVDSHNHTLFSHPHWFFNWFSGQFHQAYYSRMFIFLIAFDLNASVWNSTLKIKEYLLIIKNWTSLFNLLSAEVTSMLALICVFLCTFTTVNFYNTDFTCFLELISCACWKHIHMICAVTAGTVYLFSISLCLSVVDFLFTCDFRL